MRGWMGRWVSGWVSKVMDRLECDEVVGDGGYYVRLELWGNIAR